MLSKLMRLRLSKNSPGLCLAASILAYFALWMAVPKATFMPALVNLINTALPFAHGPAVIILNLAGAVLFVAPTVAFMVVQLAIIYFYAKIRMNLAQVAAVFVVCVAGVVLLIVLMVWQSGVPAKMHRWPNTRETLFILSVYPSLLRMPMFALIMLVAASIGYAVSLRIRERSLLLPVVMVAAWIDFWTVTRGPVAAALKKAPEVVGAISAPIPHAGTGQFVPSAMIGPGDFLFAGLVFAAAHSLGMRPARNFWFVFVGMTVGMLLVMTGVLPYLPALIALAISVIAANWRQFKLSKREAIYVAVVGVLLMASLPLIWSLVAPKQKAKPQTHPPIKRKATFPV